MSEPKKIYCKGKFVGTEITWDECNDVSRGLWQLVNAGRGEDDLIGLYRDEDGNVCSFIYSYLDANGNLQDFYKHLEDEEEEV
jgi:hypothetical protein